MAKKPAKTDQLRDSALGALKQTGLKKTDKATARQQKVRKIAPLIKQHAKPPMVDTDQLNKRLPGRKGWPQDYTKFNLDTWLKENTKDFDLNRDEIRTALCTRLREQKFELVLPQYKFRGKDMDIFAIAAGRSVEYRIILTAQDLSDEMFNAAQFGKQARNWHVALKAGLLHNLFYFVIPAGFIDVKLLPAHAGVIEIEVTPKWGQYSFTAVRPGTLLHREYVEPGTYKSIAQNLHNKMYLDGGSSKKV